MTYEDNFEICFGNFDYDLHALCQSKSKVLVYEIKSAKSYILGQSLSKIENGAIQADWVSLIEL